MIVARRKNPTIERTRLEWAKAAIGFAAFP
jgi:uncharacterized membrane protein YidH (DUF202 family)